MTDSPVSALLKKVRRLEIQSKRWSNKWFTGEYHSAFKGSGMLFKEVRAYSEGDDPRFIDWNVSARLGHPFSKVFEEERERTVLLLLDISGSNQLGNKQSAKFDVMAEMAAILAFSALENKDSTGMVLFSDAVELYIPPKKGKSHVLYLLRMLLSHQPNSQKTNPDSALQYVQKCAHHKTILFVISDFATSPSNKHLRALAQKHDAIAIHLLNPAEEELPLAGLVPLEDVENGTVLWADANDPTVRLHWQTMQQQHNLAIASWVRKTGWSYLSCATHEDAIKQLQHFFKQRMKH